MKLITFHDLNHNGRAVQINPRQIVAVRAALDTTAKEIPGRCKIEMSNGDAILVASAFPLVLPQSATEKRKTRMHRAVTALSPAAR